MELTNPSCSRTIEVSHWWLEGQMQVLFNNKMAQELELENNINIKEHRHLLLNIRMNLSHVNLCFKATLMTQE